MCVCDAAVPVHDVGGEGGGEADHVEAELGGRAQRQASHDGEEGQVHPQACRTRARGKAAAWFIERSHRSGATTSRCATSTTPLSRVWIIHFTQQTWPGKLVSGISLKMCSKSSKAETQ